MSHVTDSRAAEARRLRLLIATDAWHPQVNGVVRTLNWLAGELPSFGVDVDFITPEPFFSIGLPTYPEIRLALATPSAIASRIEALAPDAIHIATEGPIGLWTRAWCRANNRAFTTCYHTRYPEYVAARLPVPLSISYAAMRRFHAPAAATMVATQSLREDLSARGFCNLEIWRRGIDTQPFLEAPRRDLGLPRPIFLSVGRVAVEKNLEAFLDLDLPGTKVVVGDGPARVDLQKKYPQARFLGLCRDGELASLYASADVFVFPSRTDTFGLTMIEALAAGTPVAAFPVNGPRDVIGASGCGVLSEDLRLASLAALSIPRDRCRALGAGYTMQASVGSFLEIVRRANGLGAPLECRPAA